jgi:hypothetical protein
MILTGENRCTRREETSHFVHHNPHIYWPGIAPGHPRWTDVEVGVFCRELIPSLTFSVAVLVATILNKICLCVRIHYLKTSVIKARLYIDRSNCHIVEILSRIQQKLSQFHCMLHNREILYYIMKYPKSPTAFSEVHLKNARGVLWFFTSLRMTTQFPFVTHTIISDRIQDFRLVVRYVLVLCPVPGFFRRGKAAGARS